jgi:hypothetical protein
MNKKRYKLYFKLFDDLQGEWFFKLGLYPKRKFKDQKGNLTEYFEYTFKIGQISKNSQLTMPWPTKPPSVKMRRKKIQY